MAVSLISTGVQFPDSTIQTTAATASAPSGVVYLTAGTIASGTSTVDITTGVFSSTYSAYLIYISGSIPSQSTPYIYFILDGVVRTQANSTYVGNYITAFGSAGASAFNNYFIPLALNTGTNFTAWALIQNTNISGRVSAWSSGGGEAFSGSTGTLCGVKYLSNAFTTFTGIQLGVEAGGTFGTSQYKIYGYKSS